MNKSFKVVFSKARSALMVVNEATSSVQAKGTKTVIAAAAAAMLAGGAVAAEPTGTDAIIGKDASLTVGWVVDSTNAQNSAIKTTHTGLVDEHKSGYTADAALTGKNVKLMGGKLVVTATGNSGASTGYSQTVTAIGSGTIELTANNGADTKKQDATVTYNSADAVGVVTDQTKKTYGDVTVSFKKNTGTAAETGEKAVSQLVQDASQTGHFVLGHKADSTVRGDGSAVVTLDVEAGANAQVAAASNKNIDLENVVFTNNGELTLSGTAVNFKSDYAAQKGTLKVTGAATFTDASLNGTNVLVGTKPADDKLTYTETFADALTVTGVGETLTADVLTVNGMAAKVSGQAVATVGTVNLLGNQALTFGALTDATAVSHTITALNLTGASGGLVVNAHNTVTGDTVVAAKTGNKITNNGSVNYKTVTVTAGDTVDSVGLSVEGSGSHTFGAVTVAGSAKAGATMTVAGGQAAIDTLTISGISLGKEGSFEINDTAYTAHTPVKYTVDAKTVDVQSFGQLNLTKGSLKAGTMTVAKDGKVETAAAQVAQIGSLTNAGTVTLNGSTTVGDLTNTNALNASGALTIEGTASNSGAIIGTNISVNGDLTNTGRINIDTDGAPTSGDTALTVAKGGKLTTKITKSYGVGTTTIQGTFNLTELNSHVDPTTADTAPADQLLLTGNMTLDGGLVTLRDQEFTGNVQLGFKPGATILPATLTVKGDRNYASQQITFYPDGTGASGSELTLDTTYTGTYTVGKLDAKGAKSVAVDGGTLAVTDKLTTGATPAVTVGAGGTLTVTNTAIGLSVKDGAAVWDKEGETGHEAVWFNGLGTNAGKVVVTGLTGEITQTALTDASSGLAAKLGTSVGRSNSAGALLDLGALKIKNLFGTDGTITAATAASLAGVVTDDTKGGVVSGVTNESLIGEYKALKLSDNTDTYDVKGKLVLNNTGKVITYDTTGASATKDNLAKVTLAAAGDLTVTGDGAVLGEVASGAANSKLTVASANATIEGNVNTSGSVTSQAGSNVTINGDVNTDTFQVDGTVTMGTATVNGQQLPAQASIGKLNVGDTGVFNNADLTTLSQAGSVVYGTANLGKLIATQGLTVNGQAVVGELKEGSVTVVAEPADHTQTELFNKANGYMINVADAALASVGTVASDANVTVDAGAIVAFGQTSTVADAQKAFAETGYGLGSKPLDTDGVTVINKDKKLVTSVIYVGNQVAATTKAAAAPTYVSVNGIGATAGEVNVGANQMLIIDADKVDVTGTTAVFGGPVTFDSNAVASIANFSVHDKIKIGAFKQGADSAANFGDALHDMTWAGDLLTEVEFTTTGTTTTDTTTTEGTVELRMINEKDDGYADIAATAGFGVAYAMFDQNMDNGTSSSAKFNKWLYSTTSWTDANGNMSLTQMQTAAKDVASLGAITGVQTMTMDAVNQMGETVADRVSLLTQRAAGVNVWAAANGGMFEAKSLFDGAGYESDIYSGVLGVDYQFACNAVLGAALTIGTADTDNKNSTVKASTDSDLVGFSVYASKTFADVLGVSADIGYLTASNDVTANGYGQAWKFSQDTDAFTIGLRTEVLAEVGAVKLVPHIGIRYTALSTDGFEAGYKTEIDDQNVFQMPVGVTVSGDFQTGDWTVAPKFDLSVVPTFGDKDADLKLGITGVKATDDLAVRVIDSNPVQATLGVNATNGAWGFGLNYKLGVGSDDRMNNTFNVNVRYAF
ncbi:autotransporter domain-containing protein [Duodenibacillus massiliensis]|uniref:autotransporter domain-containing protein n=1 Tax=Duodenibacillus massiliensis TaxID=1852381 RepID=UPI00093A65C8|nr:autotransporter domain-containing protein [Duodenibacillus massiliensis]